MTFELFHYDNLTGFGTELAYPRLTAGGSGTAESWRIKRRYTEELHEDVEALADTLTALGVQRASTIAAATGRRADRGPGLASRAHAGAERPRQHSHPGR